MFSCGRGLVLHAADIGSLAVSALVDAHKECHSTNVAQPLLLHSRQLEWGLLAVCLVVVLCQLVRLTC
jgi:hypothetical protein